jgi:hypothetical protein
VLTLRLGNTLKTWIQTEIIKIIQEDCRTYAAQ